MKKIILLLLIVISNLAHGAVLETSFESVGKTELVEGDVVEGELKVFSDGVTNFDFKKLEGKTLFNTLQFEKIDNISNVSGASIIKGLFFVKSADVRKITDLSEDGSLSLEISNLVIKELGSKSGQLFIASQKVSKPWLLIVGIVLFLIALVVAFFNRQEIKNLLTSKESREKKKLDADFKKLISDAQKRKDYEELYTHRVNWIHLVNNDLAVDKFIQEINKYQYKPVWENHELDDVRASFEEIRRSLK